MPKPLSAELYHYTGIDGLKGIISSQTLWATHYRYLNDTDEIIHFRDRLPDILRPVLKKVFSGLSLRQQKILINEHGTIDKASEEESKKLAITVYDVTFGDTGENPGFAEPYITSYWTTDKSKESIAKHGLLSQWRGYGAQGGYAIVFDTDGLIQLLHEEGKKWDYSACFAGDVVYSSATDEEMRDEFREHFDAIQKNWETTLAKAALAEPDSTDLKDTYIKVVSCACRYKHWGFAEEAEFRIVVVPTPPEIVEFKKREGKTILPPKPVRYFSRDGKALPYLNLFEGITSSSSGKRLPIKRVIVGPHAEKEERKMAVEQLLRQNDIQADVSVSAIPYKG